MPKVIMDEATINERLNELPKYGDGTGATVVELEDVIKMFEGFLRVPTVTYSEPAQCPACRGKGYYMSNCSMCGDSTYDHECDDERIPCSTCNQFGQFHRMPFELEVNQPVAEYVNHTGNDETLAPFNSWSYAEGYIPMPGDKLYRKPQPLALPIEIQFALRQNERAFRHKETGEITRMLDASSIKEMNDLERQYDSVMIIPDLSNQTIDHILEYANNTPRNAGPFTKPMFPKLDNETSVVKVGGDVPKVTDILIQAALGIDIAIDFLLAHHTEEDLMINVPLREITKAMNMLLPFNPYSPERFPNRKDVIVNLIEKQTDLSAEEKKVLFDNLPSLYEYTDIWKTHDVLPENETRIVISFTDQDHYRGVYKDDKFYYQRHTGNYDSLAEMPPEEASKFKWSTAQDYNNNVVACNWNDPGTTQPDKESFRVIIKLSNDLVFHGCYDIEHGFEILNYNPKSEGLKYSSESIPEGLTVKGWVLPEVFYRNNICYG